jgi:photosystem II stability/assembly factor-like uncharacterized protein
MFRLAVFISFFVSPGNSFSQKISFIEIHIDTNFSFRALSVVNDSVAWVAGINGNVGKSVDGGKTWKFNPVKGFKKSDFRTLYAFDANNAIIANAGSPAVILRTCNGGQEWIEVYRNEDKSAFFDGIDFWNSGKGMIYGDPIDGKLMLLGTIDGGVSWHNFPEDVRPTVEEGEASFAASGTNIRCWGWSCVCIATGGKKSRLLFSENKGISWQPFNLPVLQGANAQGVFSFATTNKRNFVVVGGDYTNEGLKEKTAAYYSHEKKDWLLPKKSTGGYRECVEFISENALIAVGPGGADFSADKGVTWNEIKELKKLHVVRKARTGKLILAAGKGKLIRIEYK